MREDEFDDAQAKGADAAVLPTGVGMVRPNYARSPVSDSSPHSVGIVRS